MEQTLQKLVSDSEQWKPALEERGWNGQIRTVYWGGGTPSVLPLGQMKGLLQRLSKLWGISNFPVEEWTVEVNPENLSVEMLKLLEDQGVTRLSLGIQTFDDQALSVLGRRTDSRTNLHALELTASRWPGSWSADLMTGLPGQEEVQTDLRTLLSFSPPHVSLYALTIEEGTPLATMVKQGHVDLSEEKAEDFWIESRDELVASGRHWYEVSNFALPGHEGKHNQSYWRMDPNLGLGPGAASTLPVIGPNGTKMQRRHEPSLFRWLSGASASVEVLSENALLKEYFLTALRTSEGLDLERLNPLGLQARDWALAVGASWRQRGLANVGRYLSLTPEGRLILDALLRDLDWPELPEIVPNALG